MRRPCVEGKSDGFSLFELVLVLLVFSVLVAVLLNRLLFYKEAAEKASVEYTISSMKSALRSKMAHMLIEGRAQEFVLLADENPVDWLESRPDNYLGSIPQNQQTSIAQGNWVFDPTTRTIEYLVKHGNYFQPDSSGRKRIRLKVVFKSNFPSDGRPGDLHTTDSVALELVEPYKWL